MSEHKTHLTVSWFASHRLLLPRYSIEGQRGQQDDQESKDRYQDKGGPVKRDLRQSKILVGEEYTSTRILFDPLSVLREPRQTGVDFPETMVERRSDCQRDGAPCPSGTTPNARDIRNYVTSSSQSSGYVAVAAVVVLALLCCSLPPTEGASYLGKWWFFIVKTVALDICL